MLSADTNYRFLRCLTHESLAECYWLSASSLGSLIASISSVHCALCCCDSSVYAQYGDVRPVCIKCDIQVINAETILI